MLWSFPGGPSDGTDGRRTRTRRNPICLWDARRDMRTARVTVSETLILASMWPTVLDPAPDSPTVRFSGTIGAIDVDAQQITVGSVAAPVTPNTRLTMQRASVAFRDLRIGMTITVHGQLRARSSSTTSPLSAPTDSPRLIRRCEMNLASDRRKLKSRSL